MLSKAHPEPLFLTGFQVGLVDAEGKPLPVGAPSLDWWEVAWLDPARHGPLIGRASVDAPTILRASGHDASFVFPKGYALPLFSNETLVFRGGWSSAKPWSGQARAQLVVSFSRARQLTEPPQAVLVKTAWAGKGQQIDDPESWLIGDDEPLAGSYKLASGATVIAELWFKGPGIASVSPRETLGPEGKTVTFTATDSGFPRPTALGVNLFLLDKEWAGWK